MWIVYVCEHCMCTVECLIINCVLYVPCMQVTCLHIQQNSVEGYVERESSLCYVFCTCNIYLFTADSQDLILFTTLSSCTINCFCLYLIKHVHTCTDCSGLYHSPQGCVGLSSHRLVCHFSNPRHFFCLLLFLRSYKMAELGMVSRLYR